MSCPYLAEVRMTYCRASPVRKLIPTDRLTTAAACGGECFTACPLYAEVAERAAGEAQAFEAERAEPSLPVVPAAPKGAHP